MIILEIMIIEEGNTLERIKLPMLIHNDAYRFISILEYLYLNTQLIYYIRVSFNNIIRILILNNKTFPNNLYFDR